MNNIQVAARISNKEDQEIVKLVKNGEFINKADFVRTAVRSELTKWTEVEKIGW